MNYKIICRILTICLVILIPFTILMCITGTVGKGGILNDLDAALVEIEDLEKRNLLNSPPEDTSRIALREIKLVHNAEGLRNYIKEVEEDNGSLIIAGISAVLSAVIFVIRRKLKKRESSS